MRDEYDFTGGVRGKYASRFHREDEMLDFKARWDAIKAFLSYNAWPLAILGGTFLVGVIIGGTCF